ncbi:NAD-dependent epimerase/dehydratase family protein [Aeromonas enteropelogenes]|uniref:NAD-dependent epimerase/dehydratase family protein n=1 Tax=Aeromonas enteropelogenes TaxID=29489 RepID=UPI003BA29825
MIKGVSSMTQSRQIIITGATGFIGRYLVPLLLENQYDIVALGRDEDKAKLFDWYTNVTFISFDIFTDEPDFPVKDGAGLIHLAWDELSNFFSDRHIEQNLPFSYRFIKSMIQRGVSQVLAIGTCLEYGLQNGPLSSDTQTDPSISYAVAKDSLRKQLEVLSRQNAVVFQWARLFYMYGKGQSDKSILAQLESAINRGDDKFRMSKGEQLRDYLSVEDVTRQIFNIYRTEQHGLYNVCSGVPISIRSLVEKKVEALGAQIELELGYYPYNDYEPMAFWGVRDVGDKIYLPSLPNAPLENRNGHADLAPVMLRRNVHLDFVENASFDPSLIDYSKGYENSQAHSVRFVEHMKSVIELLKASFPKGSKVVEVGCGKGDFLEMLNRDGYFNVSGYDSSYNGSNPLVERRYLDSLDRLDSDLVILRHVLEHIPRPHEFLSMLKDVFGNAYIYIEVPNFDWIVCNETFFDITYEHVNYFSQRSLKYLFSSNIISDGLMFDEQYQYVISKLEHLSIDFKSHYRSEGWSWLSFTSLFPRVIETLHELDKLSIGRAVFVWGASTKGCLFLAHCMAQNLLINQVKFAVDQNPNKFGKFLPGTCIPIKGKEDFVSQVRDGDMLVICNSAYREEIVSFLECSNVKNVIIKSL